MYTWKIENVKVYKNYDDHTDVIYLVNYSVDYAEAGVGGATLYDKQEVSVSDLSDFTPFDDLTDAIVLGWVENALGTEGMAQKETDARNILNVETKQLNG